MTLAPRYTKAESKEKSRLWRLKNPEAYAEHKKRGAAREKQWRKDNPEAHKAQRNSRIQKDYRLQYYHKISLEQYESMLAEQGGVCGSCGTDTSGWKHSWAVDHDHATGKVRGLLCHSCNVAIGHAKDDVTTLQRMINYLQR
jgi:hypothetical protein